MGVVSRRLLYSQGFGEGIGLLFEGPLLIPPGQATDSSPFAIEALRNHIMFELARAPAYTPSSHNTSGASSSAAVVTNMMKSYLPTSLSSLASGSPANNEPAHIRSRREAKKADEEYREAVERLDVTRLRIEEQIENGLRLWEKWERERMGVVRTGGWLGQEPPERQLRAARSLQAIWRYRAGPAKSIAESHPKLSRRGRGLSSRGRVGFDAGETSPS